jgi:segregation and condensation protein B
MSEEITLYNIIEGALFAADKPLTVKQLGDLFEESERPESKDIQDVLQQMQSNYEGRGVECVKLASGYAFRVHEDLGPWVSKLWDEKPPKYSRAFLETLAIIAYRQPITRGEIESIRGVAVNTQIVKTLIERSWIRVVGHKDVPGKPALLATTKDFLDYFNLDSLESLPPLSEIKDLDEVAAQLEQAEAAFDEAQEQTEIVLTAASSKDEDTDSDEQYVVAE